LNPAPVPGEEMKMDGHIGSVSVGTDNATDSAVGSLPSGSESQNAVQPAEGNYLEVDVGIANLGDMR